MNALIYGRRRQGKSTLSLALALSTDKQVAIFDPNAQFHVGAIVTTADELNRSLDEGEHVVVFRPRPDEIDADFTIFGSTVWQWNPLAVIIDETSSVQSANRIHPELERLLRQAPDGVDLIQSTHRLVDTQRLTRSLATDMFFFQSTLRADLAVVEAEVSAKVAERIRSLPVYQCLHYWIDVGGVSRYSIWSESEVWYVGIAGIAA